MHVMLEVIRQFSVRFTLETYTLARMPKPFGSHCGSHLLSSTNRLKVCHLIAFFCILSCRAIYELSSFAGFCRAASLMLVHFPVDPLNLGS
jgi:hypothetical protein